MSDQLFSSVPTREIAECLIAWDIVGYIYKTSHLRIGNELANAKTVASAYVAVRDIILNNDSTINVTLREDKDS